MTHGNILQWVGAALVLVSYIGYRYGGYMAPTIGFAASVCLVAWASDARAWGYMTLNVILAGVNLWTVYQWAGDANVVRTFWRML